ncbi:hypothetical protein ACFFRR_001669 [Megaselia abdita]
MDGVLWNEINIIKNAANGLNLLKSQGKSVVYVTNNSVRSLKDFEILFKKSDIQAESKDIVNPLRSIIEYLKMIDFKEKIYCISNEPFKASLREAGFDVINDPSKILKESFKTLKEYIIDDENPGAVIVDEDFNISGPKIMRAHQYLTKNSQCLYLTGASDKKLTVGPGINILGPGYFMDLLETSAKKRPIALGKPSRDLSDIVMKKFKIKNRDRVLMIGDMLEQDIGFGKNSGFQTLLVLTGGTKLKELEDVKNNHLIPDFIADGMEDFVEFFRDFNKSKI